MNLDDIRLTCVCGGATDDENPVVPDLTQTVDTEFGDLDGAMAAATARHDADVGAGFVPVPGEIPAPPEYAPPVLTAESMGITADTHLPVTADEREGFIAAARDLPFEHTADGGAAEALSHVGHLPGAMLTTADFNAAYGQAREAMSPGERALSDVRGILHGDLDYGHATPDMARDLQAYMRDLPHDVRQSVATELHTARGANVDAAFAQAGRDFANGYVLGNFGDSRGVFRDMGMLASYVTPGVGEAAMLRDVAGGGLRMANAGLDAYRGVEGAGTRFGEAALDTLAPALGLATPFLARTAVEGFHSMQPAIGFGQLAPSEFLALQGLGREAAAATEALAPGVAGTAQMLARMSTVGGDAELMAPTLGRQYHPADRTLINGLAVPTVEDGAVNFVVHASPDAAWLPRGALPAGESLDGRSLARWIESTPAYRENPDLPIRLLACNAGATEDGLAQMVANQTGRPVIAADSYVGINPNGTYGLVRPWNGGWVANPDGVWTQFGPWVHLPSP